MTASFSPVKIVVSPLVSLLIGNMTNRAENKIGVVILFGSMRVVMWLQCNLSVSISVGMCVHICLKKQVRN